MTRLLRDRYLWYIVALAVALGIVIYGDDVAPPGWLPLHGEWHLTYMALGHIVFLAGVVIAAWRFGVKGGLVVSAALWLILVPHTIEMVVDLGLVDESLTIVIFVAIGITFSWLVGTRKQAEEALREAEAELRHTIEVVPGIIARANARTGYFTHCNAALRSVLGFSSEEFLARPFMEFTHPDDRQNTINVMEEQLKGSPVARFENRYICKDGTYKWLEWRATAADEKGVVYAAATDITERKQMEEALRESEAKYQDLYENASDMYVSVDPNTALILRCNQTVANNLGYTKREIIGRPIFDLYHPDCMDDVKRAFQSFVETGEVRDAELQLKRKDGTKIDVSLNVSAVRDGQGNVLYSRSAWRDITERKRAEDREKQLQRELNISSRLAAIGELAAGVAHEINNPLTGILGFSELLLEKSTDKQTSRRLERIRSEAKRAAKIVQNLLAFARHREPKREYADINDILQKALELRAYELKTSNVEVAVKLAPNLPRVTVDPHQIQEVFLNIILNAEHAMIEANDKGKLSIRTQQIKGFIMVSFADDGPGIPPEHIDKLFDPFFTTRGDEGGTGLGLSICHGIVTEHDGRIYARSKPSRGATFFVELPV